MLLLYKKLFPDHLYLNQFVTENNSQSSRKHICLSYNNNGKKYNIIDLCGAERPFSIEKYIKKLDDPLYIEANKPEEEAKKVENFKRLLNEFNDRVEVKSFLGRTKKVAWTGARRFRSI